MSLWWLPGRGRSGDPKLGSVIAYTLVKTRHSVVP
jgi:hypothetical protein